LRPVLFHALRLLSHGAGMLLDGLLVERGDLSRVGHSSCGGDLLGHRVDAVPAHLHLMVDAAEELDVLVQVMIGKVKSSLNATSLAPAIIERAYDPP
jgi:hypothetical protein